MTVQVPPVQRHPRIVAEVCIVLALSLGASAVYSILSLLETLLTTDNLADRDVTINTPIATVAWVDVLSQVAHVCFGLAPVALVCWLVWQPARPHLATIGLGRPLRPLRSVLEGIGLAALIGLPGVVLSVVARHFGFNATVNPNGLSDDPWLGIVLLLAAARAALLEEVIVVAYLNNRLGMLRWAPVWIIVGSALLRGSYHLYQGFGGWFGNVLMGVIFALVYRRTGRLLPLIVAHFLLDAVSFLGYRTALELFPQFFG